MTWRPAGRVYRRHYAARPRSFAQRLFDYALTAAIILLLAVASTRIDRIETKRLSGEAVVNDGDSITLKGERIRLRGIDAPEYRQTCEKDGHTYPCGRQSREALEKLAGAGALECSGWERDRYGRLLAVCTAGGVELNRHQVEQGWAVAYGDYGDAEALARENKLGLWAGSFERPRDWRVQHGEMAEAEHDLLARIGNWLAAIFSFS